MAFCQRCGTELPARQGRGRPRKYCAVDCRPRCDPVVPEDMQPGCRFARLVVVEYESSKVVLVRCDCGAERSVEAGSLRRGHTRSCGCLRREATGERFRRHGYSQMPEYVAWRHIRERIFNEDHPAYRYYGGRGLTMHPEWAESFEAFLAEVGLRPSDDLSIDRINNDLGYVPGNLRWATRSQQNQNKRAKAT